MRQQKCWIMQNTAGSWIGPTTQISTSWQDACPSVTSTRIQPKLVMTFRKRIAKALQIIQLRWSLVSLLDYTKLENRYKSKLNLEKDIHASPPLLQYIIYDWNDFVADVGGYLGLLLGQSAYGMYEILTNWCRYNVLSNWLKERRIQGVF